jgi:hypothetical protein
MVIMDYLQRSMTNFNWNVQLGQVFNITDIDQDLLVELTNKEYKPEGYSSWENTKNGLTAERMLIELCNYTNDPAPYKDVFNPDEISVEVKSFGDHREDPDAYKRKILSELRVRKVDWKLDISNYVVFFKRNSKQGTYTVDELFAWDESAKDYISEK